MFLLLPAISDTYATPPLPPLDVTLIRQGIISAIDSVDAAITR